MPVSHLGLSVSHIPSAVSFYLATLQPLGYRYIGDENETVGLGVDSADLFLTPSPGRSRLSPNHIAFSASNRIVVRECYAAALKAGGRPRRAPSYRSNECECFNAAVEDLDGNTVEFIFRQSHPTRDHDVGTRETDTTPRRSSDSKTAPSKSRGETAVDLVSRASEVMKRPDAAPPPLPRAFTAPANPSSDQNSKRLIGTVLGAAAGAAIAYAMCKSESSGSKKNTAPYRLRPSKSRSPQRRRDEIPPDYDDSDGGESLGSSSPPRRSIRTIENGQPARTPFSHVPRSRRPPRSRTYDEVPYSRRGSHPRGIERASTMPLPIDQTDDRAPEVGSSRTLLSARTVAPPSSTKRSGGGGRRNSINGPRASPLKRHDSGLSMRSGAASRHSSARSARPPVAHSRMELVRYEPRRPPPSDSPRSRRRSPPAVRARAPSPPRRRRSYNDAPPRARSPWDGSRRDADRTGWEEDGGAAAAGGFEDEDDDGGLSDFATVVPDDSISCVDVGAKDQKPPPPPRSEKGASRIESGRRRRDTDGRSHYEGSRSATTTIPLRPRKGPRQ